ncbi:MAG: mechanosensitive ion channel [Bacteroidaceae bacterium]|nr:mechanosensitive ion channel [Bacteroidaceae bacterium]
MILDFIMATATVANDSIDAIAKLDEAIATVSGLTIKEATQIVVTFALTLGWKLLKVAFIWMIGRWLTRRLITVVKLLMEKRNSNPTVKTFLVSFIDVVSLIILLIILISVLGIDTSSFIALFASAGVAIGMALSGTLQNFAGGVIILLFRPFKVGDFIEAQGQSGTVKEIQIFNTLIQTGDNKTILIPNGPLSTGIINNSSSEALRRVDFTFSISYGDDYEKAKEVLLELIAADKRILNAPAEPFIALKELGASSINIVVRVWAAQEDYWGVCFDLNKAVYETFPKRGLNFPYQTFTVNVNK